MTFSEKLITLRAGRGWSQEKLAAELGVTRQAVGRWEKGAGLPDAKSLAALARVFDVEMEWLLNESESGPQPRRAKQMQLMWYDWAIAATALVAALVANPLGNMASEHFKIRIIYPWWMPAVIILVIMMWFSLGWTASALIARIFGELPVERRVRRALFIVGIAVLALLLTMNVLWSIQVFFGPRGYLPELWGWLLMNPALFVLRNPELFLVPGVVLGLCARRKAR